MLAKIDTMPNAQIPSLRTIKVRVQNIDEIFCCYLGMSVRGEPSPLLLFNDISCSFLYDHTVIHRLTVLRCRDVRLPREELVYMCKLGQW